MTTTGKEHGILSSAPMVLALLARRKRVTRRMSKRWLKVKAGDRLWVRETWYCDDFQVQRGPYLEVPGARDLLVYRADNARPYEAEQPTWRPSIHMPRWASRITVIATEDARLERLQDITEEEAIAEGCSAAPHESWYEGMKPMLDGTRVRQQSRGLPPSTWTEVRRLAEVNGGNDYDPLAHTAREDFAHLWRSLHTKPGERYEDNPELVRLAFDYA